MPELTVELLLLLAGVALVAGAIDAIAGGGGLLTIPALLTSGVPPVAALATNKFQATLGTGGAVIAFARRGRIDFRKFALPVLAAFVGSATGAWLLTRVDPSALESVIPILLIAIAVYFLLAPKMGEEDREVRAGRVAMLAVVAGIAAYDGFFGPGTGSFLTAALVALFGFGLTNAVAHAKLLNLASNATGLLVLMSQGHVLWVLGATMAAASIVGGQIGAFLALRYGSGVVRPLLVVICLALAGRLAWKSALVQGVLA